MSFHSNSTLGARLIPNQALRLVVLPALGVLLLCLSAKISVPVGPIPVTLQTLVVLLIGGLYGARLGVATVASYLALGLVAPVYAFGGGIGLAYYAGPTGGFLLAFLLAAAIMGWAAERGLTRSVVPTALVAVVASLAIYAIGAPWFLAVLTMLKGVSMDAAITAAWSKAIAPFLAGDAIKAAFTAVALPLATGLFTKK